MFSDDSSDPNRDCRGSGADDSLLSVLCTCDKLWTTESLTEDSESLTDRVPLTDSTIRPLGAWLLGIEVLVDSDVVADSEPAGAATVDSPVAGPAVPEPAHAAAMSAAVDSDDDSPVEAEADSPVEDGPKPSAEEDPGGVAPAEPVRRVESDALVDWLADVEVESLALADSEAEGLPDWDSLVEVESLSDVDSLAEVEPLAEVDSESLTDWESLSEPDWDAELDSLSEVESLTDVDSLAEVEPLREVDAEPDSLSEVDADSEVESLADVD